jgi:hypothetical protein
MLFFLELLRGRRGDADRLDPLPLPLPLPLPE